MVFSSSEHVSLPESPPLSDAFESLNSPARLLAIEETELLDVPTPLVFGLMTELASRRLRTSVSLLTFVTKDRQYFVASYGLDEPWRSSRETPLSHSFCQHVTVRNKPLVIHDSRRHPLVCENLAIRDLKVGAYLGVPIVDHDGVVLGSFCTIDEHPREWTHRDLDVLQTLACDVNMAISDHRRSVAEKRSRAFQLQRAQRMEALGTLAGAIAHDFNNLLMVVQSYAELIALDPGNYDSTLKYANEVLATSVRAKGVVHRLNCWAIAGEDELRAICLKQEINEVIPLVRALLPSNIEINVILPESTCVIEASPAQISQIMINVTANAEHAMRESGGRLTIELDEQLGLDESKASEENCVCLSITDTGCGIEEDVQDRVCDPYFTTKLDSGGSGIGLSTVYEIIKSLKGELQIHSVAGEGTSIRLTLPQITSPPVKLAKTLDPRRALSGGAILLVDDEPSVVNGLRALLTGIGYEVTSTTSSFEAISMFRNNPSAFDLLITDQTMPELTGDRLIQAVHEIRPDFPTILLTGFSHVMDQQRADQIGVACFCKKPVSIDELSHAIDRALRTAT